MGHRGGRWAANLGLGDRVWGEAVRAEGGRGQGPWKVWCGAPCRAEGQQSPWVGSKLVAA